MTGLPRRTLVSRTVIGLAIVVGSPVRCPAEESAATAAPVAAEVPSLVELEQRGARVGDVRLDIGDVFDLSAPGENLLLFRLANRLHRETRPEVIRRMLLFRSGEPLRSSRVEETERLLRQQRYFYDARIRPVRVDGDTVDLEVDTRDVWSLSAAVGFHRSGGANTTRFQIEDSNLLGTGKELQVLHESNVDRSFGLLLYRDRNLLGSQVRLDLEATSASDGGRQRFDLVRPFVSLDGRWSAGLRLAADERIDALYDLGHVDSRFGRRQRSAELFGGWSAGQHDRRTHRFTFGFGWEQDLFTPVASSPAGEGARLPPDRELRYPWLAWEWIADEYEVASDLDKIARREDLHLGGHAAVRLGYAATAWGSTESAYVARGSFSRGARFGDRHLVQLATGIEGRYGPEGAEGVLGSISLRDVVSDFGRGRLMFALRYDFSRRLDPDQQLLIGGDSGLRGYPLRFQPGDQILAGTVEQRFYSDREIFHLFRVGAAAFVDVARVWADETPDARRPYEVLRDLGIGLRLSSSRSARAAMIHFDVAYPLDGPRDLSRVQWLVTTSETF